MILQVNDDASMLVRAGAALILSLHIAGGAVGILSGAASLILRKGGQAHRLAGQVFVIAMLIMATIGAVVSPFLPKPEWANVSAGAFTFYLVLTAWMTARRKSGVGRFEVGAAIGALCIAVGSLSIAWFEPATKNVGAIYVFASFALIAGIGDIRLVRRGGIAGVQRIVRHLWRMGLALWIATASLFLGQPQVFPKEIRGTGLLLVPVLAVLLSLIYWLIRVRVGKRYKTQLVPNS